MPNLPKDFCQKLQLQSPHSSSYWSKTFPMPGVSKNVLNLAKSSKSLKFCPLYCEKLLVCAFTNSEFIPKLTRNFSFPLHASFSKRTNKDCLLWITFDWILSISCCRMVQIQSNLVQMSLHVHSVHQL